MGYITNIGVMGNGYVGGTLIKAIKVRTAFKLSIYDKYQEKFKSKKFLEDVIDSHLIFICVPTPMLPNGAQDNTNLIEAIKAINVSSIIIIKSTIIPGTTAKMFKMFPQHSFIHSPEFLKEESPYQDFINADRVVLGILNPDSPIVPLLKDFYRQVSNCKNIFVVNWEEAEMCKYISNSFLALKISFANEMEQICEKLDLDWDRVRETWISDTRVGNSHTQVPGPDGFKGYGGKCFPKDVKAFIQWALNSGLNVDTVIAANKVNERVRDNKDWIDIVGATSDNNYR